DRVQVADRTGRLGRDRLALVIAVVVLQARHEVFGDLLAGVGPDVQQRAVALAGGNSADAVLLLDLVRRLLAFLEDPRLGIRGADVGDAEAQPRQRRALEPDGLHVAQPLVGRWPARGEGALGVHVCAAGAGSGEGRAAVS